VDRTIRRGRTRTWPRWHRSLWYHGAFYLQTWRASVISTFLFPLLYLASMGLGVGHLVSAHTGLVEGRSYLRFVAPGLLAITAMNLGESESMWPVLGAVKWVRTYHAAVATPLEPEDIVLGKLAWVGVRLFFTGVVLTITIAFFGALNSWWALTLPLLAVLIGLAFAAPLMAFASTRESDASFTSIYRFLIIPMFLFSATFYPMSQYPGYLRPVVQLMPLYHGVALARSAAFGHAEVGSMVLHLTVLGGMLFLGLRSAKKNLRRRLAS